MCCHGVGGGSRPSPLPPMSGISSPESNNNAQRRNPLEEIRDVMEGKRATRMKKAEPESNMLERVRGMMEDFLNKVKKTMPSAPVERPGVTPR
jgi:hypothetical protein